MTSYQGEAVVGSEVGATSPIRALLEQKLSPLSPQPLVVIILPCNHCLQILLTDTKHSLTIF